MFFELFFFAESAFKQLFFPLFIVLKDGEVRCAAEPENQTPTSSFISSLSSSDHDDDAEEVNENQNVNFLMFLLCQKFKC